MEAYKVRTFDRIEHSNADHARVVLVDWMLGNACSYACSYCPSDLHDGSIRWQKPEAVISFFDQLYNHYIRHRGRRVWLQFTGGEPTMHPQIIRLLEEASARGFSVSLISNASRSLRFWQRIAPHLNSVILTYHSEFADPAHFLAVAGHLEPQMPMHINVTMRPEAFDASLAAAQRLRPALPRASIALKPLRLGFEAELYDYSDEQLAVMKVGLPVLARAEGATPRGTMTVEIAGQGAVAVRANEMTIRGENRWPGYLCNAGLESLRVRGDGRITRAVCSVGGKIGRLGEVITLPTAPVTCTAAVCACEADMLISKSRPKRQA